MDANELENAFEEIAAVGPVAQVVPTMPGGAPSSIAVSGTWNSGVIPGNGFKALAVGVTSSQGGSLVITTYLDAAGTIQSAVSTTMIVATVPLVVNLTPTPFLSWRITISNGGGGAAAVTGFAALMNAA